MNNDAETSPVKPTVIDLDPDDVMEDRTPAEDKPAHDPAGKTDAAKSAAQRSRSSLGVAGFSAALVIAAIGGGWLYRDVLAGYFPSDQAKALSERVEGLGKGHEALAIQMQSLDRLTLQLKSDVDALESSVSTATAENKSLGENLTATRSTLATLEAALAETTANVATLANRPAVAATGGAASSPLPAEFTQRLAALEQDVAALKAQKSGAPDGAALSQTIADLRAKVEAGTAFSAESDRLARLLPAASGLDVLAVHAAAGLPNAKGLATELAALKPSLPVPDGEAAAQQEPGLWDRMVEALSSVITIRSADAINWQQIADKAIAFAEAGDIAQAVTTIDGTEATIPAGLQQWRDRAAARIALETAAASVADAASRVIAAGQ